MIKMLARRTNAKVVLGHDKEVYLPRFLLLLLLFSCDLFFFYSTGSTLFVLEFMTRALEQNANEDQNQSGLNTSTERRTRICRKLLTK
jgi:hypothetical protein